MKFFLKSTPLIKFAKTVNYKFFSLNHQSKLTIERALEQVDHNKIFTNSWDALYERCQSSNSYMPSNVSDHLKKLNLMEEDGSIPENVKEAVLSKATVQRLQMNK